MGTKRERVFTARKVVGDPGSWVVSARNNPHPPSDNDDLGESALSTPAHLTRSTAGHVTHPHRPVNRWASAPCVSVGGVEVRYQPVGPGVDLSRGREVQLGSLEPKLIPGSHRMSLEFGRQACLIEGMRVHINGAWADFSTAVPRLSTPPGSALAKLQAHFPQAKLSGDPLPDAVGPHVRMVEGAEVNFSRGTRLEGECWIGGSIGAGAHVRDSYVLGTVREGATLDGACVLEHACADVSSSLIHSGLGTDAMLGTHGRMKHSVAGAGSALGDYVRVSRTSVGAGSVLEQGVIAKDTSLGERVQVGANAMLFSKKVEAEITIGARELLDSSRSPAPTHAHPSVPSALRQMKQTAALIMQERLGHDSFHSTGAHDARRP